MRPGKEDPAKLVTSVVLLSNDRNIIDPWNVLYDTLPAHEFTPGFLVGPMLLIFLIVFCVVLLWVPHKSDVRFVFIFSVLYGAHVLFTLIVLVCVKWCPTHAVLCFLFCFSSSCCQILWIVNFCLPLRYSLMCMCWYLPSGNMDK